MRGLSGSPRRGCNPDSTFVTATFGITIVTSLRQPRLPTHTPQPQPPGAVREESFRCIFSSCSFHSVAISSGTERQPHPPRGGLVALFRVSVCMNRSQLTHHGVTYQAITAKQERNLVYTSRDIRSGRGAFRILWSGTLIALLCAR